MDCSTPGFPVLHCLLEFAQTHVHWVSDAIYFILCCLLLLFPSIFPASGPFPVSQLFASGSQSNGASASVLPMNIKGWFPLGLTGFASNRRQPKYPLVSECLNKMQYIHTMKYNSGKRNHTVDKTQHLNPQKTILSRRSQS